MHEGGPGREGKWSPAGKAVGSPRRLCRRGGAGRGISKEISKNATLQHELPATLAQRAISLRVSEHLAHPSHQCWGRPWGWPVPRVHYLRLARGGDGLGWLRELPVTRGLECRSRPQRQSPARRAGALSAARVTRRSQVRPPLSWHLYVSKHG